MNIIVVGFVAGLVGIFIGIGYGVFMQRDLIRENEALRDGLRFARRIATIHRLTPLANHIAQLLSDEAGA
jgi:hypothetical protein